MTAYQSIKGLFTLGSRYQVGRLRVGIGIWLLFLTSALYGDGHGGQWAWLLAVAAAVHFGLAHRSFRAARRDSGPRTRFQ